MKLHLFLAAVAVMGLASCASQIERRVSHNPQIFNKLSTNDQQAVRSGRIREGMGKEAVFLAWGRPDRVAAGKRDGKNRERWSYAQYEQVQRWGYGGGLGMGMGYGYGGYGWLDPIGYAVPMIDYVPVPGRSVEFAVGTVTGVMVAR